MCESVAADLGRALAASSRIYNRERFVPAQAKGTLRLGLPDHMAYLYGPTLLSALRSAAPAVDLQLSSFSADWRLDLQHDRCDLAFAVVRGARGALRVRRAVDDPWVVMLRRGHPALEGPWSAKRFAQGEHAIMSVPGSGPSPIDRALGRRGLKRSVVYRASSPLVVAMAAVESELRVADITYAALEPPICMRGPGDGLHRPTPGGWAGRLGWQRERKLRRRPGRNSGHLAASRILGAIQRKTTTSSFAIGRRNKYKIDRQGSSTCSPKSDGTQDCTCVF